MANYSDAVDLMREVARLTAERDAAIARAEAAEDEGGTYFSMAHELTKKLRAAEAERDEALACRDAACTDAAQVRDDYDGVSKEQYRYKTALERIANLDPECALSWAMDIASAALAARRVLDCKGCPERDRYKTALTDAVALLDWAAGEARGRLPEHWHQGIARAHEALTPKASSSDRNP